MGLIGFALKHNMDRILATAVFEREWGLFNYWISPVEFPTLTDADARFLLAMVAMSLPFIWVGVAMTLKRLRSAGLPAWGGGILLSALSEFAFLSDPLRAPGEDAGGSHSS